MRRASCLSGGVAPALPGVLELAVGANHPVQEQVDRGPGGLGERVEEQVDPPATARLAISSGPTGTSGAVRATQTISTVRNSTPATP